VKWQKRQSTKKNFLNNQNSWRHKMKTIKLTEFKVEMKPTREDPIFQKNKTYFSLEDIEKNMRSIREIFVRKKGEDIQASEIIFLDGRAFYVLEAPEDILKALGTKIISIESIEN